MGVDGPHKTAGHLQNTPKTRLPLGASGSQSALYDAVSKQILRGQFPGGSGSGLQHHVVRIGCKSRHRVFGRHQEPIGDHCRKSARMDALSSPTPRSHGNVAYLSRAWPGEVRGLRIMRSGASNYARLRGVCTHCSVLLHHNLSCHAARAHHLGYVMTVLGYGRRCAGGGVEAVVRGSQVHGRMALGGAIETGFFTSRQMFCAQPPTAWKLLRSISNLTSQPPVGCIYFQISEICIHQNDDAMCACALRTDLYCSFSNCPLRQANVDAHIDAQNAALTLWEQSQIAPENTKNVAYTRKPHSMAAPIERPHRAAPIERPDRTAPMERPDRTAPTEHDPHRTAKSNEPNRTPPIERPNRTLQSNVHNRAARSNGPKPNVPNRAAPIERPNPNRPPASQSRKKKPTSEYHSTAHSQHSFALERLEDCSIIMCLSQR